MNSNLVQFDQLKADIQIYIQPVKDIVVDSKVTQEQAMLVAKELKERLKAIEALRVQLVKPHNDFVAEINGYAKELKAMIDKPADHLNQQFLGYNRKLEEARQAEIARIRKEEAERQAAAQKLIDEAKANADFERELGLNDQAAKTELVAAVQVERATEQIAKEAKTEIKKAEDNRVKGVTLRWDCEIVDLSKVPIQFLLANEVAIRKAIVESKGTIQIPGVKNIQKESMSIR